MTKGISKKNKTNQFQKIYYNKEKNISTYIGTIESEWVLTIKEKIDTNKTVLGSYRITTNAFVKVCCIFQRQ